MKDQASASSRVLDQYRPRRRVWRAGHPRLHRASYWRLRQAADHFEFALGLCRQHGHCSNEAELLAHLGDARYAAGELPQARQAWQQALAIYEDIDHPDTGKVRAKLASLKD